MKEAMKNDDGQYQGKIEQLDKKRWQGYELPFNYISHNYYDVEIKHSPKGFDVTFIKKPFDEPYINPPNDIDKLFKPWWEDVKAWGIVEEGQLVAAIETAVERWSNRMMVTVLWIADTHRRKGIATALMDIAVRRAKDEKRRAIILETQSRNEGAVAFYLAYGFTLIGFDSCAYQNNDLDRNEVRLDLGIFLEY